jgi:restriction system protein
MGRRGFFAELQYQSRLVARERERQTRTAVRAHQAAVRALDQAQRQQAQTRARLARAMAQDRKRLEREANESHLATMEAEVEERNLRLAELYDDIDSLLSSTLTVDDYVDLNSLRLTASHPAFDRGDLEAALPPPLREPHPPEPSYQEPAVPTGLAAFFTKKKHLAAVEEARRTHEAAIHDWRAECQRRDLRYTANLETHARNEGLRLEELAAERRRYEQECNAREDEVTERNRRLDDLIANLGYGTTEAVQEYVSIVLSNSAYPAHFLVSHEFSFDPGSAELRLKVLVPEPGALPTTKAFKYAKSADEIVATDLPQKATRDRYAGAVCQVALRSLHEVFESDRRGLIRTVSLEVGTEAIDPATGRPIYVPFVVTAAERETFLSFDLSAVVPAMTLERLGASVSKNPSSLTPAQTTGVRRS